jgi:NitT/TauT family transport system substrate-binding protein
MLRKISLAGLVALHLCLAGGAAAQTKVRVGNINTGSDVGLFVADARGYFKAEGLDVDLTSFSTAAKMIGPLAAGQLDVGGGTVSAGLYNAVGRDIGIRIVADKGTTKPGYTFSVLMVRQDLLDSGRYKTFADLKGMRIATASFGTGNAAKINAALIKGGLKYSDAEMIDLGFPDHIAAFANKRIDASMTSEPIATLVERGGVARRVPGNDDIYPNHQTAVLLYAEDFAKSHADVAQKFMRAYLRGVRDYNDALKNGTISGPGADDIAAILMKHTGATDPRLYRETTTAAIDPDGKVNVESLSRDLAFFREQGLITTDIAAQSLVDMSFADRAAADLGPYKPKTGAP